MPTMPKTPQISSTHQIFATCSDSRLTIALTRMSSNKFDFNLRLSQEINETFHSVLCYICKTYTLSKAPTGKNGKRGLNIGNSTAVAHSFYSDDLNPIPIGNYAAGFTFWITKNSAAAPSFETVRKGVNSTITAANQIQTYRLTLTSANQSITIQLAPSVTTIAYLVLLKYGGTPIVNSTLNDYDIGKIFCPSGKCVISTLVKP